MGNLDFATFPSKKSTRKYTGGVIYSNYHGLFVVFLVASPADWIFARILQFFITACYGGTCTEISNWKFGNGLPFTGSSNVL